MSLKNALLVPIAFLGLLLGIVAVLVGLYCTAECVAAAFAREWHRDWGELALGLGLLVGGMAVLDVLVNRWQVGKMRIGGRKS